MRAIMGDEAPCLSNVAGMLANPQKSFYSAGAPNSRNGEAGMKSPGHGSWIGALAIAAALAGLALPALADKSQPLAERKALYAPWNPADMPARRRAQGLSLRLVRRLA